MKRGFKVVLKGRPLKYKVCKMIKGLVQRKKGMKKYTSLILSLLIGFNGTCGYEEGIEAFERGDYEKAYRHLTPLAIKGDMRARTYLSAMDEEEDIDTEIAKYLESSESTQLNKHFRNAMLSMISIKQKDEDSILRGVGLLSAAASLGKNAFASYILGKGYFGRIGHIPRDEEEGILYLRKAIQLNGHQKSKLILEEQEKLSREVWEMHHREVAGAAAADAESQVTFKSLGWERGSKYTDIREDGLSIISKLSIRTDKILEENPTGIARARGIQVPREQIIARCQGIAKVGEEAYLGKRESLPALIRYAEEGDHLAEAYLAIMYATGECGVPKDEKAAAEYGRKALKWLMGESTKGNAYAQVRLGLIYEYGLGVTEDEQEAVRWYRLAANQGNGEAQNNLGVMYANGRGVVKDVQEAVKWYKLAADQGHADGQFNLGWMYKNGQGVAKDDQEAAKWYRLAADQGYAYAQNNLGVIYENGKGVTKDYQEAERWFRLAADQGDTDVQYKLGGMYENGQGIEKDEREAAKWYRKAADLGNADAQYSLGEMYKDGRGVEKDEKEAERWFRLAADQEDAHAHYSLGLMYEAGRGVEKDEQEAVKWYRRSAEKYDSPTGWCVENAQYRLGEMYEDGRSVAKDEQEAVRWFRLAADRGYADAQYRLGLMYEKGCGVEKDDQEAVKWLTKAADQGNADAHSALERIQAAGVA
jgi:TPR repeat protein